MNEQQVRTDAFLAEKDRQLADALNALCALKGELAVAQSKIAALTEALNAKSDDDAVKGRGLSSDGTPAAQALSNGHG